MKFQPATPEFVPSSSSSSCAPDEFICPSITTLEMMQDPVIAAYGITYERSAIERVFQSTDGVPFSPKTKLPLSSRILINDGNLLSMCCRDYGVAGGDKGRF
jgi:hypothetical protein